MAVLQQGTRLYRENLGRHLHAMAGNGQAWGNPRGCQVCSDSLRELHGREEDKTCSFLSITLSESGP